MTSKDSGVHWACHPSEHLGGDGKVSEGLALLNHTHPEVLRASLDLRSLLGGSLSPDTKELIRIATHAERGSHSGLRCAVPRALAEGATPDQVIDAILLLLPETGLGTVIDGLGVVAEFLEHEGVRENLRDNSNEFASSNDG